MRENETERKCDIDRERERERQRCHIIVCIICENVLYAELCEENVRTAM